MKIPPKDLKVSDDLLKSVKLNTVAQALEQTLRPDIEKIQRSLLKELQFTSRWAQTRQINLNATDQIVLDPKYLHHLNDQDSEKYFKRLHQKYLSHGYTVKKPGNCPLLEAEWIVVQTENLIIDCAEYATGLTRDQLINPEFRKQYLAVTIRMVFGLCQMESSQILEELRLDPKSLSNSIEQLQNKIQHEDE